MNKPNKVITHHAVSSRTHNHLDVGRWHYDRWNGYRPSRIRQDMARYAGYHYIINWDGTVEQCRAHDEEGIHCKGQNFSSIGVCFMGNNDLHLPSPYQIEAYRSLYRKLQTEFGLSVFDQYPHRKYANKSCHGALLSDTYWVNQVRTSHDRKNNLKDKLERLNQLYSRLLVYLTKSRMK